MQNLAHRGARPGGLLDGKFPDPRLGELDEALRIQETLRGSPGNLSDSSRVLAHRGRDFQDSGHVFVGMVVQALPYVNWYLVQGSHQNATMGCSALAGTGLTPLGPRAIVSIRALDTVIVYKPRGLNYGHILGVLPPQLYDPKLSCPDWVLQGGGSGLKRERAHQYAIKNLYKGGGVFDWSNNRPLDETSTDVGWITPTGLALTIDDYLLQMRVNEQCGLFLSYFDSFCRLAGRVLRIESSTHEEEAADDEGEARLFRGVAAYPWEALGLAKPGSPFTKTNSDKDVQFDKAVAAKDLLHEDTQPIYRYQEYGGYLGQGHWRAVVKPGAESGVSQRSDGQPDLGLFRESIALDGSYSLVSAKSVHIGKRIKIPVPKQLKLPEDGRGDDKKTGGYKFSSQFGGGAEHKIGDLAITGEAQADQRILNAADFLAHDLNWKPGHPFHYHTQDYDLPQESEASHGINRNQESLDYAQLARKQWLDDPTPRKLNVDHRYGDVNYYERESFLKFHDDGSVHLSCGAGAELIFAGGKIKMVAPGGVELHAGTDLIAMAGQIVLRSKGSVDVSSSDADVRIKAENNLHVLAGNSGQGGLLLESRGTGTTYGYQNRFGEDVESSGIVLKAAQSTCALLGKDVYVRTGGDTLGSGNIVLDADRGRGRVSLYGQSVQTYATDSVAFVFGPVDDTSDVKSTYLFNAAQALFGGGMLLKGKLFGYGESSGIFVNGSIEAVGGVTCSGRMADSAGGVLGKVPSAFRNTLQQIVATVEKQITPINDLESKAHNADIVATHYGAGQIGNEDVLSVMQFGFRDPPAVPGDQYGTTNLKLFESRWQQLVRLGGATGGSAWTENSVICQGVKTDPWPGRKKWAEEPVFQQGAPALADIANGYAKDLPGSYEDAKLAAATPVTAERGYTLIRG